MTGSELTGTTALVTGASRGFGRGIAIALHEPGANVVAVARSADQLDRLRDEVGRTLVTVTARRCRPSSRGLARRSVPADDARPQRGRGATHAAAATAHVATFSRNWDVDTQHVFHWTREALLAPLAPGSTVIAMSSGAALRGSPLSGGYAAAKAGVRFIASYAAEESARSRTRHPFRFRPAQPHARDRPRCRGGVGVRATQRRRCRRVHRGDGHHAHARTGRQVDRRPRGVDGGRPRRVFARARWSVGGAVTAGGGLTLAPMSAVPASGAIDPSNSSPTAASSRVTATACSGPRTKPKTPCRTRWCAHGAGSQRSRIASGCGRGCTAIATNVCLDMLKGRTRRAQPMDLVSAATGDARLGTPRSEATWVQPVPDDFVMPAGRDPRGPRGVARVGSARVHRGVAALGSAPARGLDSPRCVALARGRSRDAARHEVPTRSTARSAARGPRSKL